MGSLDGMVWVIDPLPLLIFGLLLLYLIVLISLDFLPMKKKVLRICPKCGRRWPPTDADGDTLVCDLCRHGISLGPKPPEKASPR